MPRDAATDSVLMAHRARWDALDPWLPVARPLPSPAGQDTVLTCDGGEAIARARHVDPATFEASWSPATRHELIARAGGTAAMDMLLAQWHDHVSGLGVPGQPDTQALVTWPSRDTEMTRVFLAHGLVPLTVLAARPAYRSSPAAQPDLVVRALTAADIETAAALWVEAIQWDAQFGAMTVRASTEAHIRKELTDAVTAHQRWVWLATDQGQVAGLLVVAPPESTSWAAPLVALSPVAYLTCLGVAAGDRGRGGGTALVQSAHAALDQAQAGVTLLHYAALSPLSGPFWHRCGYRPLWTTWAWPAFISPVAEA
jgi:ribosomal protein S18 acetylase RimI-like enzyme